MMKSTLLAALTLGCLAFAPSAAHATTTQLFSVQDFPAGASVIENFSASEFATYGVTGSDYLNSSGSLVGNADAPLGGSGAAFSGTVNTPTFVFADPILSVGFSTADIDFGHDDPVGITLTGLDEAGMVVAGPIRIVLQPANSAAEENAGAKFLGLTSDIPFSEVVVTATTLNLNLLDHLVFEEAGSGPGPGCDSAPAGTGTSLLGALLLGLGLFIRPRSGGSLWS